MAPDRAQPRADAAAAVARGTRSCAARPGVARQLRCRARTSRRGTRCAQHMDRESLSRDWRTLDRLLLRGVRAAPVAADLCGWAPRAGRRPLQGSERPRAAADL